MDDPKRPSTRWRDGTSTALRRAGVPLMPEQAPPPAAAVAFRRLAARVEALLRQRAPSPQVVMVTSPSRGAGKTLVSVNLALTLARSSGLRVLLIEGDVVRPAFSHFFVIPGGAPTVLSPLLAVGGARTDERENAPALGIAVEDSSLRVMPAGAPSQEDTLFARRIAALLERARTSFDLVLIDAPPAATATTDRLTRCVDGAIVLVRRDVTRQPDLERALEQLGPQKTMGLVFTHARGRDAIGRFQT